MNPPQQVAHALLERIIAMRAPKASGCAEIPESGRTEGAARCVALRRLHLLVDALEEVRDLRLGSDYGRLHAALGGAALAETEQTDSCPFDYGQLGDRVRFLANITHHPTSPLRDHPAKGSHSRHAARSYDYVADDSLSQLPAFQQQHPARPSGKRPVMSDDDHTDLQVIHDLGQQVMEHLSVGQIEVA